MTRNWKNVFQSGQGFSPAAIAMLEALEAELAENYANSVHTISAADASVTVGGTANDVTLAAEGGGSQPDGMLLSKAYLFTETAGAGTYTASFPVAAGTVIAGVNLKAIAAAWDADTIELDMGDTLNGATSYFNGYDVMTMTADYSPTTSPETGSDTLINDGSDYNNAALLPAPSHPTAGITYAGSDTITMVVTTTGAGGTTGRLLITIYYFTAQTPSAAVKS